MRRLARRAEQHGSYLIIALAAWAGQFVICGCAVSVIRLGRSPGGLGAVAITVDPLLVAVR